LVQISCVRKFHRNFSFIVRFLFFFIFLKYEIKKCTKNLVEVAEWDGEMGGSRCGMGTQNRVTLELVATRVFLPTARFLPLASGNDSNPGYRGIPLNTVRIQISNQNR
jgi:hypothetical protein